MNGDNFLFYIKFYDQYINYMMVDSPWSCDTAENKKRRKKRLFYLSLQKRVQYELL